MLAGSLRWRLISTTATQPLRQRVADLDAALQAHIDENRAQGERGPLDFDFSANAKGIPMQVHASIFKAYDIRGVVGQTISDEFAEHLGRAFGTEALKLGERSVAVGRDGRLSGPSLSGALIKGLRSAGVDVIELGAVTTPMLYYVAATRGDVGCHSGIQVTGSHNPKDYNGFKMVLGGAPFMATTSRACASASKPRITRAARARSPNSTYLPNTPGASSATANWRAR